MKLSDEVSLRSDRLKSDSRLTCSSSQLGGWLRVPLPNVRRSLSSQYGAYPGGPSLMKQRRYFTNCKGEDMPLALTAHSLPLALTAHSLPLALTAHSLPLALTAHSLPLALTAHSLPLALTAHSLPLALTAHSLPLALTAHSLPLALTAHSLPSIKIFAHGKYTKTTTKSLTATRAFPSLLPFLKVQSIQRRETVGSSRERGCSCLGCWSAVCRSGSKSHPYIGKTSGHVDAEMEAKLWIQILNPFPTQGSHTSIKAKFKASSGAFKAGKENCQHPKLAGNWGIWVRVGNIGHCSEIHTWYDVKPLTFQGQQLTLHVPLPAPKARFNNIIMVKLLP